MFHELIGGPFCRFEYRPMNLNSSPQVKEYLFANGWEPDEWNFKKNPLTGRDMYDENGEKIKSSPKLTESSFHTVKGEVPQLIARRNVLMHRMRMIKNTTRQGEEKGFLNLLRNDGRIAAGAIPLGTNTGRMRHVGVVNIPSVDAVYGEEIRSLFKVPEGYEQVGVDASALEARMQAHYVFPFKGGPELADLLINGDIHTENSKLWYGDVEHRKQSKSPYYCLMYGGQPPKLATTMGVSVKEAELHFEAFWNQYTPLTEFKTAITEAWKARGGKNGGYLRAIDGRKIFARSEHALVNLMFQSAGSITVKLATVYLDKWIKQSGLRARQIIHMHDEMQFEVHVDDVEKVRELALKAFEQAGKFLKFNVPIVGEAKVGRNWAECH